MQASEAPRQGRRTNQKTGEALKNQNPGELGGNSGEWFQSTHNAGDGTYLAVLPPPVNPTGWRIVHERA